MHVEERYKKIMMLLHADKKIEIRELAHSFQVSRETIRRDLKTMEIQGRLIRVHGGAMLPENASQPPGTSELPVNIRAIINVAEKKIICKYAAKQIQNEDTIFIDNSTTCIYLYQYIPKDIQVTILTNSVSFLVECAKDLSSSHTVVFLGGILKSSNLSAYGTLALQNAKQYFPCKAFISCTGIVSDAQITDSGIQEIDVKKTLMENSQEVFLLADHTKFAPVGQIHLCNFADIDHLITDTKPDISYLRLSKELIEKIIVAQEECL